VGRYGLIVNGVYKTAKLTSLSMIAFYCRCITGPAMVTRDGILFISDNYLCFSAERRKERLSVSQTFLLGTFNWI
jgi:hypothetical protein